MISRPDRNASHAALLPGCTDACQALRPHFADGADLPVFRERHVNVAALAGFADTAGQGDAKKRALELLASFLEGDAAAATLALLLW